MEPPVPDGQREAPAAGGFGGVAAGSARAAGRVHRHRQRRRAIAQGRAARRGRSARHLLRRRSPHAADRAAESLRAAEVARPRRARPARPPSGSSTRPAAAASLEPRRRRQPAHAGAGRPASRSSTPSTACRARSKATRDCRPPISAGSSIGPSRMRHRAIDALNRVLQTDTAPSRLTVPTKLTRDQ